MYVCTYCLIILYTFHSLLVLILAYSHASSIFSYFYTYNNICMTFKPDLKSLIFFLSYFLIYFLFFLYWTRLKLKTGFSNVFIYKILILSYIHMYVSYNFKQRYWLLWASLQQYNNKQSSVGCKIQNWDCTFLSSCLRQENKTETSKRSKVRSRGYHDVI